MIEPQTEISLRKPIQYFSMEKLHTCVGSIKNSRSTITVRWDNYQLLQVVVVVVVYYYVVEYSSSSSSSSSSRDGLIGPLPAKCRLEAFDAHSFTTLRERGKTG